MEVVARPQEIHVLARTEIGSLADLAGKKVSFGPVGGSAAEDRGIQPERMGWDRVWTTRISLCLFPHCAGRHRRFQDRKAAATLNLSSQNELDKWQEGQCQ